MKNIPVILAILFLCSCKKDISELPAPSETGSNTFGARVDETLWVPQGFGIVPTAPLTEARVTGLNALILNARNFSSSPTETEFEIYISDFAGVGTYQLNQNTAKYPGQSASYGYYIKRRGMPLNEWITDATHTGSVVVTRYDPAGKIVAGSFSFTAGSTDNTASLLKVTEGRFDLKLP
ncbi:MAG TPA: hypothetical protein VHK91_01270 [Flavisolibacter sp.]|jgi:hypothetical protein|nr:hypothetical protein [Flavisolibacter sp.]